jgi:hypothetical protein
VQLQNQNRLYTSTINMLNYFLYMSVNAMNIREKILLKEMFNNIILNLTLFSFRLLFIWKLCMKCDLPNTMLHVYIQLLFLAKVIRWIKISYKSYPRIICMQKGIFHPHWDFFFKHFHKKCNYKIRIAYILVP